MTAPDGGMVVSVNTSARKTVRKTRGQAGNLIFDRGFEGDAHAGDWHRQVSLLGQESIEKMVDRGLHVGAGGWRACEHDMPHSMGAVTGAGPAAPQIGVPLRVVIFGMERNPRYPEAEPVPYTELVNPVRTPPDESTQDGWEGCR
mgnify:CR=1 FL=1